MQIIEGECIPISKHLPGWTTSPLPEGEVHLWKIPLNADRKFMEKCDVSLTDKEQKRVLFYKLKKVQDNYRVSQGGLRLLLSSYLGIEPSAIQLGQHAKGKPFCMDDLSLCFNISNSGNYCVYAFARNQEVGIDIEEIRVLPDLEELIEQNFSEKERRYINGNEKFRQKRFFDFWTMKEAYLKAIGEGMRLCPDSLEFSVEHEVFKLNSIKGIAEQEDWLFRKIAFDPNYAGSISYKGEETKIVEKHFIIE